VELAEVTVCPERMRMSEMGLRLGASMAISVRADRRFGMADSIRFERQWMGSRGLRTMQISNCPFHSVHNASVSNQGSPPIIFLYSSSVKARQVSVVKLP
jgi:hypothetical protein